MFILQNIRMPDENICSCADLYYHMQGDILLYDGYFNILSCRKWSHFTEVNDIKLRLEVRGSGEVCIYSEDGEIRSVSVGMETITLSECEINLPQINQQDFLWFSFRGNGPEDTLVHAAYITEQIPAHKVQLAVDICTFRREEYVRHNLSVLRKEILDNQEHLLHGKLDIYVIDNGQTLSEKELGIKDHEENVFLIYNKNAGGTGGFTRGMLEVLKRKKKKDYTHIILMDDDAVLEPEAFIRCNALLSFLRDEFRNCCISGAMLDLEKPYIQNEAGSLYLNGQPVPLGSGTDLRGRSEVIENERLYSTDYAGWWWACYSLKTVREDNLPLPFFIHFDDIEYGVRNKPEIILLNGICIWHPTPLTKRPQTNVYYDVRNRLVTNSLRTVNTSMFKELKGCLNEMGYHLLKYQYSTSEMVLKAVKDFTAGPKYFGGIDPVSCNEQIRNMSDPMLSPEQLTEDVWLRRRIYSYINRTKYPGYQRRLISKRKYITTVNGWLLPARMRKNEEVALCDLFQPDMRELYRSKEGILIDPYAQKGAWVRKDYRKALRSLFCMLQVCFLMATRYHFCVNAYRRWEAYLTGKKFWKKYLCQSD